MSVRYLKLGMEKDFNYLTTGCLHENKSYILITDFEDVPGPASEMEKVLSTTPGEVDFDSSVVTLFVEPQYWTFLSFVPSVSGKSSSHTPHSSSEVSPDELPTFPLEGTL